MGWRSFYRRSVLVHLRSGKTLRGVLWIRRGPLLVLRRVELLDAGGTPVAVDGEVIVERSEIEFVQALTPGT